MKTVNRDEWITLARQTGSEAAFDCPLCDHTSFRIGGPAELLLTVPNEAALSAALKLAYDRELAVRFLGNGSNLLIDDAGLAGVTVRLTADAPIVCEEDHVTAFAGTPLKAVCRAARDHNLSGLEFAFGIPGSVGGGVFMNAGAYGGELGDVLSSVRVMLPDGSVETRDAADLRLSYRFSDLMEHPATVLSAVFLLKPGDRNRIEEQMNDFMSRRRDKQPLEYPSAGSYFKRPTGYFAGALIEQSGLKGASVGGAQISEKHAGFLINRGGATCDDVLRLEDKVRETVLRDHGVTLEREVRYWK